MLRVRARDNSCFVAYCNAVGGQDELIFDGDSVVIDDEGEVVARAAGFEEELLVVDLDPVAAVGRRLRDVRRRAWPRACGGSAGLGARARPPNEQGELVRPLPAHRSTTWSRCAARSSSACATTCRRTASATS